MSRRACGRLVLLAAVLSTGAIAGTLNNMFFAALFLPAVFLVFVIWPTSLRVQSAAIVGAAIVLLGRSVDAPAFQIQSFNQIKVPVPSDEEWRFTFDLRRFQAFQEQCGQGTTSLVIHGTNLKQLAVTIQGVRREGPIAPFYVFERLRIPLDRAQGLIDLRVKAMVTLDGQNPRILQGSEIHSDIVYPDAVFIEFEGPTCRIVLHSRRGCPDSCYDYRGNLVVHPPELLGN